MAVKIIIEADTVAEVEELLKVPKTFQLLWEIEKLKEQRDEYRNDCLKAEKRLDDRIDRENAKIRPIDLNASDPF